MNDEAEAALKAGVPEERIHIERFGVATEGPARRRRAARGAPGDAETARVVIVRDGLHREIGFSKEQPSILDGLGGRAGSAVLLHLGRVRHLPLQGARRRGAHGAQFRPRQGRGGGFVLSCQAHPLTPRVVLSFDER
jgi:ring-1,2-phenylacetyl-CoA epoxidase subunit PaaE